MSLFSIILTVHIIAGFSALFIGIIPMISKKGGKLHKTTGMVYFWSMFMVFFTSSTMFFLEPDRLLFLFLVGIFSFYQTLSGYRILRYKKASTPIATFDITIAFLMGLSGLSMLGLGIYNLISGSTGTATVYLVFGAILSLQGIGDYLRFKNKMEELLQTTPKAWLYHHISRMGGSYIATFTAFIVVNNTFMPPLVGWLGPGVIGGFIISRVIRKYKRGKKPANV